MATIYRFIVENGSGGGSKGVGARKRNPLAKAKSTNKGGVEANRYQRMGIWVANKVAPKYGGQAIRYGRAVKGLFNTNENGKWQPSGVAIVILIQAVIKILEAYNQHEVAVARRMNTQNFRRLELGTDRISGNFTATNNFFNGKIKLSDND